MSKILIAGTCYNADEGKLELTKLWIRLARHLNPETDIVLIDSASPFEVDDFAAKYDVQMFKFPDNIGAISQGQRDGSGRAFIKGLELAIEGHYSHCMIWEADMMFALPANQIVAKMARSGVKITAPQATPYLFGEWGCSFWSSDYLRETKFIERYDWENAPPWPIPEWRIQTLVDDVFFILPLHGMRNDHNQLNVANLANHFPYRPPSWLTHCVSHDLFYRFLDLNKIELT